MNEQCKKIVDNRNRIAELQTQISEAEYEKAQLLKELNRLRAIAGEPPK